jgi:hypothetical protein
VEYLHDFGFGFQRGYMDVSAGLSGCPPVVPAEEYWCFKFRSASGQERIAAWFAGYDAGVAVAEQSGVRGRNYLAISPFRRAQLAGIPTAAGPGIPLSPAPHLEPLPLAPAAPQDLPPPAARAVDVHGAHGLSSLPPLLDHDTHSAPPQRLP